MHRFDDFMDKLAPMILLAVSCTRLAIGAMLDNLRNSAAWPCAKKRASGKTSPAPLPKSPGRRTTARAFAWFVPIP
jgi:hypothetical protein